MKTKRFRTTPKAKGVTGHAKKAIVRSYEGKLDSKKRLVIRGARHTHYRVREQSNGSIILTPQELVEIEPISPRSMAMLEKSIENFKKGIVSEPIDLSYYRNKMAASRKRLQGASKSTQGNARRKR